MKAKEKFVTVNIRYTDRQEFEDIWKEIKTKVRRGFDQHSGTIGTAHFKMSITMEYGTDWKEELINGEWCRVYQSKLNEKPLKAKNHNE